MGTSSCLEPPPPQHTDTPDDTRRPRRKPRPRARRVVGAALLLAALAALASVGMALAAMQGHPTPFSILRNPYSLLNQPAPVLGGLAAPVAPQATPTTPTTPAATPAPTPTSSTGSATATACSGGDRTTTGDDVVVEQNEWLCGSVATYDGDVTVLGRVGGNVTAAGGDISISGEVDGNVTAFGGDITLLPGAFIGGNVQSFGGNINESPDGVTVSGTLGPANGSGWSFSAPWPSFPGSGVPWLDLIFWALASACVAYFFPSQLLRVERMARVHLGASLLIGGGVLIVGIIAAVVLVFTCVGIPVALVLALMLWLGSIFGTVALGAWLGGLILRDAAYRQRSSFVLSAVLGTVLLALASNIPCAGGIVWLGVTAAGLGASVLTLHQARTVPSYARL